MKHVYDARESLDAHMMADALERQGISAEVKGEFDPLTHERPSVWIVNDQDYDEAARIVEEVAQSNRTTLASKERVDRKRSRLSDVFGGFLLGVVASVVLYTFDIPDGIKPPGRMDSNNDGVVDTWRERQFDGTIEWAYDTNFDGKADEWTYYRDSKIQRGVSDSNFDGRSDSWRFYDPKGLQVRAEADVDFDGRVDMWESYKDGVLVEVAFDNDGDGKRDEWSRLERGRLVERMWSYFEDGIIDKKAIYKNGRKVEEFYDRNRDGRLDESVKLDEFERVISRTKL
ncbi:MAG TPA: DUF2007 domain-containing protein [bacterium]|nr:DUF2007 domain-containing protein [bacterium]